MSPSKSAQAESTKSACLRSEPHVDLRALATELKRAMIVESDEIPADVMTMTRYVQGCVYVRLTACLPARKMASVSLAAAEHHLRGKIVLECQCPVIAKR